MTPPDPPEKLARHKIDAAFASSGWRVQDRYEMNLAVGRGVAVREFKLMHGHGFADYLLFVDGKAVGKLVDQDPSDEPASMLLARIRAERGSAPPKRGRRGV